MLLKRFVLAVALAAVPLASRAQVAAPSPRPVATWAPAPTPTIPPDLRFAALQTQAQNAIFGLLAPYCQNDGGFVGATLSGGASPYPVLVSCVKARLRIDAPGKATPLP